MVDAGVPRRPTSWVSVPKVGMSRDDNLSRPAPSSSLDLGALYTAHAAFLARTVARLTGAGAHVDDVVQEVFLIAHRKHAVVAEHPDPRGWLYRTARNVVQHHRRSIARRLRLAEAVGHEPDTTHDALPDELMERKRHGDAIRAVVASLPDKQREVFVLYELEQLSGEEVATMLEIPAGTVWTRLHHARKRFKELWLKRHGGRP